MAGHRVYSGNNWYSDRRRRDFIAVDLDKIRAAYRTTLVASPELLDLSMTLAEPPPLGDRRTHSRPLPVDNRAKRALHKNSRASFDLRHV
ncbi:protein of unknown function [Agrobacterium pusense]|uniref:Uncharacterized protein n=1 Tax=Agrobacterium pusense TaxID=648995 RepID=U4Q0T4_9HYPH|nr:protein of unknown function [Agrobacterium pusense]